MFYLKYRPQTIAEIDNQHVVQALTPILKQATVPHAFLFIGQKGTGKTSAARIFAKSINCRKNKFAGHGTSIEPCNTCAHCLAVNHASSPDVFEMDAASNRGIEEVKKLIKESNFMPMMMRYRVFIIDEAHMITPDAFNALLKTLEEPPAQVIFILATTNPEKVPKTIASRCLTVKFGKATPDEIVSMLRRIQNKEKVSVDEKVLYFIATHAEHSFRDAAKIFEELVIQNKLDYSQAKQFLGAAQQDFLEILAKRDQKQVFQWVENFSQNGGNFKGLIEETLEKLRLLLLANHGINLDSQTTISFTPKEVVRLMKYFTEAYTFLKISPIESIPLEIALFEFYNDNK
ncbi:DNA polymerase III subunit gamma/tau [Candidatus Roizmanbacteria bacterium]|nr:DNA polymerase III subunit gamma/tau [Candidatus Roizmanbacteria bacterium]